MTASITEFRIEAYDEVLSLWKTFDSIELSCADSKDNIRRYLENNQGTSFVAYVSGVLVGAILCGHDGRRGYLYHVAVRRDYQGQGIGSALVAKCLSMLESIGIQRCHVFVFSKEIESKRFWKKLGFVPRTDICLMSKDMEIGKSK